MRRLTLMIAVVLGLLLAVPGQAQAAWPSASTTTPTYVVHAIPGVPVDVYVNGELALPGFQPGSIAGPFPLPSGCCPRITIYRAGADVDAETPLISSPTALPSSGGAVSLVAHLTPAATPILSTFYETNRFKPSAGYGKVLFRHTAALGPVDLYIGQGTAGPLRKFTTLSNRWTGEYVLPAGNYRFAITPAGTPPSAAPLRGQIAVTAGGYRVAYAIGNPAAGTLGILTQQIP